MLYPIFLLVVLYFFSVKYGIDHKVRSLFVKKNPRWKPNKWTHQIYGYSEPDKTNHFDKVTTQSVAINQIVLISCVLFMVFWTVEIISPPNYETFLSYFAWNSHWLGFIQKPWTIITSGFSHVAGFHLLFNMMFLISFSKIMKICIDDRTIWNLHIWGTVGGTLLVLVVYNIFPYIHSLGLGASCGIFAMMSALAYKMPNYSTKLLLFFIIPVTVNMKQMLYFGLGLSLLMVITGFNAGGGWAHIGGAIVGWYWMTWLDQGKDVNKYLNWFTKRVL